MPSACKVASLIEGIGGYSEKSHKGKSENSSALNFIRRDYPIRIYQAVECFGLLLFNLAEFIVRKSWVFVIFPKLEFFLSFTGSQTYLFLTGAPIQIQ